MTETQNTDREWILQDMLHKFQNTGRDSYLIMQLRHDEIFSNEQFASMRQLERQGKEPDPTHYETVYGAELPAEQRDTHTDILLELLFQKFNVDRPKDFYGHSLSVSDVIALKRDGEVSVHYVDSIGFKELSGFLGEQERASVLKNLKEKCDAPECNPTGCRKGRDDYEL